MISALIAGFAMLIKDGLEAVIAQAENRHAGMLAGLIDLIKWPLEITTGTIAIGSLLQHGILASLPIVICVELGNFFGRYLGTKFGDKFIKP